MRLLLLSITALFVTIPGFTQTDFKKNTFYFELAGNGGFLSVNYERQIQNKTGFGYHVGIGIGDSKPDFPMGMTYIYGFGKKSKSFIEFGAGITLAEQSLWDEHAPNIDSYPYKPGWVLSIGYRHHTHYGLMWKLNYTPIFTSYRNIPLFFGFSLGWRI